MGLKLLIVDDEPLARSRIKTLLTESGVAVAEPAEAASAAQALQLLKQTQFDGLLLDIHMPQSSGLDLAATLRSLLHPPGVVFVSAHATHALQAFELDALDYLTKPVRLQRLQQALQKIERYVQSRQAALADLDAGVLLIYDRGRTERVPVVEVLYLKAELKYLTVRTALRSYILDASLAQLETQYPAHFLRIHRNALVARRAIRALERHIDSAEGETWSLRLQGLDESLQVSRRQLAQVRQALSQDA